MKGKKLLVVLVVLALCLCTLVMGGITAFLILNANNQAAQINQLQNQLNSTSNTTVNNTTANTTTNTTTNNPNAEDWTVTSKTDTQETATYKINVIYPQLVNSQHADIAADVNKYITDAIKPYETGLGDGQSGSVKNSLSFDYDVKLLNNKFVSIVMTGQVYLGGAHPTAQFITINYDLNNNQALTLQDIFNPTSTYATTLSTESRDALIAKEGAEIADNGFFTGGTSANAANFKLFYLTQDSFGIIFPEYQVAPYAMGPQTVEFPLSAVDSMFTSEFSALL